MTKKTVVVQGWRNCPCKDHDKVGKETFRSVHSSLKNLKNFIKGTEEQWEETLAFEGGHSCTSVPIGKPYSLKVPQYIFSHISRKGDGLFLKAHQKIARLV